MRVLGLATGGERGLRALRDSLQELEGSPWRLEHARTLVELGAAIRRLEDGNAENQSGLPGM